MKAVTALAHETPTGCELHADCEALILNLHHTPPKSWKPNPFTAKSWLCGTGHQSVHAYIDMLVRGQGTVPTVDRKDARHVGSKERALARKAYRDAIAQGLTLRPTL